MKLKISRHVEFFEFKEKESGGINSKIYVTDSCFQIFISYRNMYDLFIFIAVPTILMKKKKSVSLSDAEVILLLKAYQLHPCSWEKILKYMKDQDISLPADAKQLYASATAKQLKSRLSAKFGKLMALENEKISNETIR